MTRNNDDCYFYYYSTCAKGNACTFRHCAAALGNETVCPLWQEDRCFSQNCKLRHAEIVKDRKRIPCYWESQPGGCQKEHCVFMHSKPKTSPVQTRLPSSQTSEANEPTGMKRSGSQMDVIKENAAPSPKVNPVLITMDHDDENSNGDKVASPTKSFSPIMVTGPKTIRTKKSLENVEEPNQLKFGIKSLEQIRKEKERLKTACSSGSVASDIVGSGPVDSSPESTVAAAAKDCKQDLNSPVKQQSIVKGAATVKTHDESRLERSKKSITVTAARADGHAESPSLQRSPVKLSSSQAAMRPQPKKDQIQDIAEVRIKTFTEIMEEKKKRREKELALKEGNVDTAKKPEIAAGLATASTLTPTQPPSRQIRGAVSAKDSVFTEDMATSKALPENLSPTDDRDTSVNIASTLTIKEDTSRRSSAVTRPTASVAPLGEPRVDVEQGPNQRASKRKPSVSSKPIVGNDEIGSAAKRSKSSEQTEEANAEVPLQSSSTVTTPRGGDELMLGLDDDDKELNELLRSDGEAGSGAIRSSESITSVNDDDLMREMAVLLQ